MSPTLLVKQRPSEACWPRSTRNTASCPSTDKPSSKSTEALVCDKRSKARVRSADATCLSQSTRTSSEGSETKNVRQKSFAASDAGWLGNMRATDEDTPLAPTGTSAKGGGIKKRLRLYHSGFGDPGGGGTSKPGLFGLDGTPGGTDKN